jgi:hypothetical protein
VATLATSAEAAPSRAAVPGDRQWIFPAAILVAVQFVIAVAISDAVGFGGRPPLLQYAGMTLIVSLTGGSVIVLSKLWRLWREKEPRPVARLWRESDRTAVALYLFGAQLVGLEMGALTWLKEMIPWVIPYWADPALASADRAIFGTDAWRLVPEWLMHPLDLIYVTWGPVMLMTLMPILCLRPSRKKTQVMLTYFLVVGLMGVCGQYFLSSAGPVFYDRMVGSNHFADLLARIDAHAHMVKVAADYLWVSYVQHTDVIGNGISAMPSMHVATTAWSAMSISSFWPKLKAPAWLYWLVIFIGSFAVGWHYFVDAAVATAGAIACWMAARIVLAEFRFSHDWPFHARTGREGHWRH